MISIYIIFWLLSYIQCLDFDFGLAISATQIEGGWLEDNKTFTVWDNLAHSGYVFDGTTPEIVDDSYHKYHQDISLLKEYGIKHYRISIPWTRVMPRAVAGSPVNMKAVAYYRKQLQELKDAGIVAYVNIFHNDLPAILVINGTGISDPEFPDHFAYYANVCFENFGDLVPYWFSFDEPWCQAVYDNFQWYDANTKPYIMGHNMILAHAKAAKIYREKYKNKYKGKFGVNLEAEMMWPNNTNNERDVEATRRRLIFQIDWFAEPFINGDYPQLMKDRIGSRLPQFTPEEKEMVKGSIDFFAFNHYIGYLVADGGADENITYFDDVNTTEDYKKEWKRTDLNWPIVPEGLYGVLNYVYKKWVKDNPMEIFVTENGIAVNEQNLTKSLNDVERVYFMHEYIGYIGKARAEGIPVTKYFGWSLLDNFEWGHGLSKRFGLVRVDYKNDQKRTPKSSMRWYSLLIDQN